MANLDTDGDGDSDAADYPAALKLTPGERTALATLFDARRRAAARPDPASVGLGPQLAVLAAARLPPAQARAGRTAAARHVPGGRQLDDRLRGPDPARERPRRRHAVRAVVLVRAGPATPRSARSTSPITDATLPPGLVGIELDVEVAGRHLGHRWAEPGQPAAGSGAATDRAEPDRPPRVGRPRPRRSAGHRRRPRSGHADLLLHAGLHVHRARADGHLVRLARDVRRADVHRRRALRNRHALRRARRSVPVRGLDRARSACSAGSTAARRAWAAGTSTCITSSIPPPATCCSATGRAAATARSTWAWCAPSPDQGCRVTPGRRSPAGSATSRSRSCPTARSCIVRANYFIDRWVPGQGLQHLGGTDDEQAPRECDGAPATTRQLRTVTAIAARPDGSVVLAQSRQPGAAGTGSRICLLTTDGRLIRLAGTDNPNCGTPVQCRGDGGPALDAVLTKPYSMTLGEDGSIYFYEDGSGAAARIRKIDPGGLISTYAGGGTSTGPFDPEGRPALADTLAAVRPQSLAMMPDGTLLMTDPTRGFIIAVGTDGFLHRYAGLARGGLPRRRPAQRVHRSPAGGRGRPRRQRVRVHRCRVARTDPPHPARRHRRARARLRRPERGVMSRNVRRPVHRARGRSRSLQPESGLPGDRRRRAPELRRGRRGQHPPDRVVARASRRRRRPRSSLRPTGARCGPSTAPAGTCARSTA